MVLSPAVTAEKTTVSLPPRQRIEHFPAVGFCESFLVFSCFLIVFSFHFLRTSYPHLENFSHSLSTAFKFRHFPNRIAIFVLKQAAHFLINFSVQFCFYYFLLLALLKAIGKIHKNRKSDSIKKREKQKFKRGRKLQVHNLESGAI